ncbi:MAG: DUF302 domain-containing protein [Candidatus Promineifilaceae bacterium]
MSTDTLTIGRTVYLDTDMEDALDKVASALKAEGFGIITEIDVKQTLKTKIDVDFRPYRILGACNPPLAHRALSTSPQAGLLLPCNVTVSEIGLNRIEVSIIDPLALMNVVDDPNLRSVAEDAQAKLERVADSLEES